MIWWGVDHRHLTRRQLERMFGMPYQALVRVYYRNAWARQAMWFWMEWPIPKQQSNARGRAVKNVSRRRAATGDA